MGQRLAERRAPDQQESLVILLMRQDLLRQKRSDSTIDAYALAARRFEKFVRNQSPPEDPELLLADEAIELIAGFFGEHGKEMSNTSRATLESALAAYLRALDAENFTRGMLKLNRKVPKKVDDADSAARMPPSTPLTDRELYRLRRRYSDKARHPGWVRTIIELGITGLTWKEILELGPNQVSLFGNPQIMLPDRTVPVYETKTVQWLASHPRAVYPRYAHGGKAISERLAKQKLTEAMRWSRGPAFGSRQGIRALHATGVRRLGDRGKSPNQIERIYGRRSR